MLYTVQCKFYVVQIKFELFIFTKTNFQIFDSTIVYCTSTYSY